MDAAAVLQSLIRLSEKAANIAKAVRSHSDLFDVLVQEKEFDKRRQKPDFKTLADVTIQVSSKNSLAQRPRSGTKKQRDHKWSKKEIWRYRVDLLQ